MSLQGLHTLKENLDYIFKNKKFNECSESDKLIILEKLLKNSLSLNPINLNKIADKN